MNTGIRTSATSVSRHDSTIMATRAEITVTELPRMDEAVLVTTDCTPDTSLPRRDWISPVRVEVKNASFMRCRWANRRSRRPRMTRLPSAVVR